jgi:hypothetical protein
MIIEVKEDRQPDKVTSGRADSQKDPVDKANRKYFSYRQLDVKTNL